MFINVEKTNVSVLSNAALNSEMLATKQPCAEKYNPINTVKPITPEHLRVEQQVIAAQGVNSSIAHINPHFHQFLQLVADHRNQAPEAARALVGQFHQALAHTIDSDGVPVDADAVIDKLFGDRAQQMAAVYEDRVDQGEERTLMGGFDPGAWEQHISVLIGLLHTMHLDRRASAQMRGDFSIQAYAAGTARSHTIVKAGNAAMLAAVSGAVATSVMAMGGGLASMKGFGQKHVDVKTNQRDALKYRNTEADLKSIVSKNERVIDNGQVPLKIQVPGRDGNMVDRQFEPGTELTAAQKEILGQNARDASQFANNSELSSALNQKSIQGWILGGQAMGQMAMGIGNATTAVVNVEQFAQQAVGVMHENAQSAKKASAEAQAERERKAVSFIQEVVDTVRKVAGSRTETLSFIASKV